MPARACHTITSPRPATRQLNQENRQRGEEVLAAQPKFDLEPPFERRGPSTVKILGKCPGRSDLKLQGRDLNAVGFKMRRFWEVKKVENEREVSLGNGVIKGGKKQKGKIWGLASQKEKKRKQKLNRPAPHRTNKNPLKYLDFAILT